MVTDLAMHVRKLVKRVFLFPRNCMHPTDLNQGTIPGEGNPADLTLLSVANDQAQFRSNILHFRLGMTVQDVGGDIRPILAKDIRERIPPHRPPELDGERSRRAV